MLGFLEADDHFLKYCIGDIELLRGFSESLELSNFLTMLWTENFLIRFLMEDLLFTDSDR